MSAERRGVPDPAAGCRPVHAFLAADALVLKVREGGRTINVHALVAVGGNAEGYREILGLQVSSAEDGAGWLAFCGDLTARGLTGVALVTSDAHRGLIEAIGATLPGASWQRCRTHYPANLMSATPKSAWGWVKALLHSVYDPRHCLGARPVRPGPDLVAALAEPSVRVVAVAAARGIDIVPVLEKERPVGSQISALSVRVRRPTEPPAIRTPPSCSRAAICPPRGMDTAVHDAAPGDHDPAVRQQTGCMSRAIHDRIQCGEAILGSGRAAGRRDRDCAVAALTCPRVAAGACHQEDSSVAGRTRCRTSFIRGRRSPAAGARSR